MGRGCRRRRIHSPERRMRGRRRPDRRYSSGAGRCQVMADSAKAAQEFPHDWTVDILRTPPLIAPARQFTYPHQIAGEEDALARGSLQLLVHPMRGGTFLAT